MSRPSKLNDAEARSYGVFLTAEQRDRINVLAFLRKQTRSELIRDLVQEALNSNQKAIDYIISARESLKKKA